MLAAVAAAAAAAVDAAFATAAACDSVILVAAVCELHCERVHGQGYKGVCKEMQKLSSLLCSAGEAAVCMPTVA